MGIVGSKKFEETEQMLPLDIIMEILSWLPFRSLSRAQLICKAWQELIYGHHFIENHMNHNKSVWYWHNVIVPSTSRHSPSKKESFSFIHGCDGLILIKNNSSRKYCLWNPATRLVLKLPDPHADNYGFALSFVPSTGRYTIVAIYIDKESGAESCEVFDPGYSKAWRSLKFPDINADRRRKTEKVSLVSAGGVVHCVLFLSDDDLEEIVNVVVSLDLETESFTVNHLPEDPLKGYEGVYEIDWNGKLAVVVIRDRNLQVMELENYKRGRWSLVTKAIRLLSLKEHICRQRDVIPLFAKNGVIWFWLQNQEIFTYTIETGQIAHIKESATFSPESNLYVYKPSLITFEGMQQDTKLEYLRPRRFD